MRMNQNRLWMALCALGFGLALAITGCAKRAVTTEGMGQTAPPPKVQTAKPAPAPQAAKPQTAMKEKSLEQRTREQVAKRISGGPREEAAGMVLIHFDLDKYTLAPEARDILKKNAEWLRKNPKAKALIEGNTDERGTAEYNLALGEKRAHSARQYLVELGIPADRLSTISYGEDRPLDPKHNEDAWAKNRRDAFTSLGR